MIKSFDAFRFYAFLGVFLFHIEQLEGGYLGVQAFFVLSGFLITPILLDMKGSLALRRYIIVFYGRRILRLFPLYFAYLLGVGIIAALVMHIFGMYPEAIVRFWKQLPYALTYTYDFYHASIAYQHTPLLTHFWFLAVQAQCFFVWPLFIWICPISRLPFFLYCIILLGPLVRFMIFVIFDVSQLSWLNCNPSLSVFVLPFSHVDAFAVGGLLSISKTTQWERMAWPLVFLVLVAGFGTQYIDNHKIVWKSFGYPGFMSGQLKFIWGYSLINMMFGCILCALRENTFLPSLFSNPLIKYLGKISYGLYVYHYPVIWLLLSNRYTEIVPRWILYVIMFFITSLIALISYEYLEKKFILMKERWFTTNA